jgi:VCBS repeat-containing protein
VTTTRRRFASLIAFGLATGASACSGDGVVLPDEAKPAAIAIVSGDTQQAPAGAALDQPLVVKVTDALNRPVEGRAVAFTIDLGGGQVTPASVPTGTDGQATATWTLGAAAGQQRVQARVSGTDVPATLLVKFNASAVSGSGSALVIVSGDNQTAPVRSALADSLVVKVADALGNPVAGVAVQWTAVGGGSISPATVTSGADGLAKAERVLGSASGTQSAEASSSGLATVSFTHTAVPANPTTLILVSGDAQSGPVGTPLADSLVVRLEDDNGNGVGGKAITWVIATGGGSPSPVTSTTSATGFAKTRWTLGPAAGSNLINAVFSGLPSVQFVAMAGAGTPVRLAFTQPPVNTRAGTAITPSVKVAIQDAGGNTVTSSQDPITLAIGNNPAAGSLAGTLTVAAVNGVATFPDLSIDKAGNGYTLTAAASGLTGATSAGFDILPGNANRLVFIAAPSSGNVVGQTFSSIQVQVQDAGGNPVLTAGNSITLVSSVTGTLSGTATRNALLGTATFTNLAITKAGTGYTLTALSSGLVSATSDAFDVAQGATTITIGTRSPGTSVPGQNVTVNYDINLTAPAAGSLTGSVTVSDGTTSCTGGVTAGTGTGSCSLAFPNAGTRQLTATYLGDANFLGSTSSAVAYTVNPAATSLAITQDTPDPSVVDDVVTIHWNLTSSGSVPMTGDVTLTASPAASPVETCSAPAALGAGSCQLTFTQNGARTITASYLGDANYNAPTNAQVSHAVLGATSTTLASSANPSTAGQSVSFTAHVTVNSGTGSLTGQVQFSDGANHLGGAVSLNGSGDAVLTTSALAVASHKVTAAYLGSATFAASTSDTLTQVVNSVPNVPPTAADDPSYTVLEDGTLNVSGGSGVLKNDNDPDHGPSTLVARNASDPAGGTVVLAANGSFTYTPDPDFNGTDTFTYEAFDGADAATATVTVTVTAVNDPPSFTSGGDVVGSAGGGPQSQPWATAISAGPADESGQTLTFDASIAPADQIFFLAPPAIASDGTLSYTPSGLTGSVTVTVHLQDNGGTSNSGNDTSGAQSFTLTLN